MKFRVEQKKRHTVVRFEVPSAAGYFESVHMAMLRMVRELMNGNAATVGLNKVPGEPTQLEGWVLPDATPDRPNERLYPHERAMLREALKRLGFEESGEPTVAPEPPVFDQEKHLRAKKSKGA